MEETLKIRLAGTTSKRSANSMQSLNLPLDGSEKLLPMDRFTETLSLYDVYLDERKSSQKYRIAIELCPIMSNPIFNYKTEFVKFNGDGYDVLNYYDVYIGRSLEEGLGVEINGTIKKGQGFKWNSLQATRDTQLSSPQVANYTYFCGLDIFNNHILRNISNLSAVMPTFEPQGDPVYNTFATFEMQKQPGLIKSIINIPVVWQSSEGTYFPEYGVAERIRRHLYTVNDLMTFHEAIGERLKEKDGWFGFYNRTNMRTYNAATIERVINNEPPMKFITMYPGRDELSLLPTYNKDRERFEDVWQYCLTYPSSSTTQDIPFLYDELNSIKINITDLNSSTLECTSKCAHGLENGDTVNIYINKMMAVPSALVRIEDNYAFSVENATNVLVVNEDDTISFKRVVEGVENQYYVRIFSRLPNFRFADKEVTEVNLYKK